MINECGNGRHAETNMTKVYRDGAKYENLYELKKYSNILLRLKPIYISDKAVYINPVDFFFFQ